MPTLSQLLIQLSQEFSTTDGRQLVVLSGGENWGCELVNDVINDDNTLWLGDGHDDAIAMEKAHLSLGREYQSLVFNAYSGFHPDAFGQAIGALNGGGVCYLVVPHWQEWQGFDDPDYLRYVATKEEITSVNHYFIARLQREIKSDSDAIIIEQSNPQSWSWNIPTLVKTQDVPTPFATNDQATCVNQIINVAKGHRNRPLVINADRGRGKSSALGIAAAQLLQDSLTHIIITAPKAAALDSVFFHAMRLLEGSTRIQNTLRWNDKSLRFVAPDELVQTLPVADLVMVDEAAAIPAPMLSSLASHYSRLVFSTTIHGYEGTGRGFVLKFLAELAQISPQMRRCQLNQPIRWQENDPVERLSNRLLGLNTKAVNLSSYYKFDKKSINYQWLTQFELSQDNNLLEQLFGLLVLAHYQTSPSDFRQLLDAPNLHILVAIYDGSIVGASLILREGELPDELATQISLGKRRLRGHLLPQSLLGQLGIESAGGYKYGRVMRIAVHPQWQHSGIGSQLDNHATEWAQSQDLDVLGSSFGATAQLTQFWIHQGYTPVRLGFSRDSASGTHSLMVLKPIHSGVVSMIDMANTQFSQALRYDLADAHSELSSQLVVKLMATCKDFATLGKFERSNIDYYVRGNRPLEQVNAMIEKGIWSEPAKLSQLVSNEQQLIIKRLLQRHSWSHLSQKFKLTGKKATHQALRQAIYSWRQLI